MIFCYVEDQILLSRKELEIDDVKRGPNNTFRLKDLGKPKRFLQIYFICSRDGSITMTQTQRTENLLQDTYMSKAKAVCNVIDLSQTVKNIEEYPLNDVDPTVYRIIVRSLRFLATTTRPSLSVEASILASHLHNPTNTNMINAKRTPCYLHGTIDMEMNLRLE